MEDNEKEVEETTSESETNDEVETTDVEETEEDNEDDNEDGTPTIEDYQKLKKEAETLKAQKEHWRKKANLKATEKETKEEINKPNTEQVKETDIIELARLASKGYSDEEISLLKDIKTLKGFDNLAEAINTPLFKANLKEKEEREKKEKASLNASGKPLVYKSGKEPSREELKKAWTGR